MKIFFEFHFENQERRNDAREASDCATMATLTLLKIRISNYIRLGQVVFFYFTRLTAYITLLASLHILHIDPIL